MKLKKSDITPIINYSFSLSFSRKDTNCKVMHERGLNPSNNVLLVDLDILATRQVTSTALVPVAAPQLNSTATSNAMVMYYGGRPMRYISME